MNDTMDSRLPVSEKVNDISLRNIRDSAFCWQCKRALTLIRESCEQDGIVASVLAVYLALTEIASDFGGEEFTATERAIAAKCGLTDRTVRRALHRLVEVRLLTVKANYFSGTNARMASTYRLLGDLRGGEMITPPRETISPRGETVKNSVSDLYKERKEKKESRYISQESLSLAGEGKKQDLKSKAVTIYQEYPRKVARTKAVDAIEKCLKSVPFEELVEKTKQYASAVSRWGEDQRQFIPHPATWYGQGRYLDDPQTWERRPATAKPSFQKIKCSTLNTTEVLDSF